MQCPGQDSRYWDANAVFEATCPKCGNSVEFFKDDVSRKCGQCSTRMLNPKNDFGCASYCPYASQCLGSLPPELLAKKQELLKERVGVEMKRYFADDFRRIGHASRVARHAVEIAAKEECNPAVVEITAYLHDIGIKESERKYHSASPKHQHLEGPPVAREILLALDAPLPLIDEVCDIIGHHHLPRPEESMNFKVLYDADLITNLEEKQKDTPSPPAHLQKIIDRSFLTKAGATLAAKVLLKG
ncbi:HD domain-containing protein [Thiovibrio frasassiensis]|uniref:HD domain-containing protein n=1 Tax=Thiovibrio frasassiensis TaxID=2984131 RepID=A0A9X4MGC0_9BACT|nr:HD domain-containing protein [Thiovibrio frasassiensis]MDG4475826.1 HD domain-containing protein [Thiovibrio frasassiensis]